MGGAVLHGPALVACSQTEPSRRLVSSSACSVGGADRGERCGATVAREMRLTSHGQVSDQGACQSPACTYATATSNEPGVRSVLPLPAARSKKNAVSRPVIQAAPFIPNFVRLSWLVMISNNRLKWTKSEIYFIQWSRAYYGQYDDRQFCTLRRMNARLLRLSDLQLSSGLSRTHGARATGAVATKPERFLGFTVVNTGSECQGVISRARLDASDRNRRARDGTYHAPTTAPAWRRLRARCYSLPIGRWE